MKWQEHSLLHKWLLHAMRAGSSFLKRPATMLFLMSKLLGLSIQTSKDTGFLFVCLNGII